MPVANPDVTIVIPARYASTRFPGKPLALLAGKPLIHHVYEQATRVPKVSRVLVATDDVRIHESVERFGGRSTMVAGPCRTGTDRVAEAIREFPCEIVVNLQADEVLLSPDLLLDLIDPFLAGDAEIGTLCRPLTDREEFARSSVVKVVTDRQGRALYFSRARIPHVRDQVHDASPFASLHVGVYIFRRETLSRFAALPSGELEEAEKLEQLRALEHGIPIHVWETTHASLRIDTHEDLERANASWDELIRSSSLAPGGRGPG
ncbi:MAG: 3-deoxy-manno-octulosonate cytidylyltransferase [Nitrospira sp.]|nr:3-deoxy-manno-octulosonate cytidylyltransferase [Nitrospira sp.]